MRNNIFFSFICALMLIVSSDAISSERGDHRYKGKSEYRESKRHYKKNHRHRHYSHDRQHRKHRKHRRRNDAAIFVGGALLGAALNSHYNHHNNHSHRETRYSYQRDRRGDCFRVEYRRGKEIWFSVPRRHCRVY